MIYADSTSEPNLSAKELFEMLLSHSLFLPVILDHWRELRPAKGSNQTHFAYLGCLTHYMYCRGFCLIMRVTQTSKVTVLACWQSTVRMNTCISTHD